jgi:hypothetical protein
VNLGYPIILNPQYPRAMMQKFNHGLKLDEFHYRFSKNYPSRLICWSLGVRQAV